MIKKEQLGPALSYAQYRAEIERLLNEGKSTGHTQTEEYLNFSRLNVQRMNRVDKTVTINPELREACEKLNKEYYLVIISEGWCGDSAQIVPVFAALEKACSKFELKILLRDDNEAVMQQYLSNGSRSVPKVICLEKTSLEEKFTWGPRPAALQARVMELLANKATKEEKGVFVQQWYNADKTQSIQKEMLDLVRSL